MYASPKLRRLERIEFGGVEMPPGEGTSAAGQHDEFAAYRGLAPGWYRDETSSGMARYWDGAALSEERRPIAPPAPQSFTPSTALASMPVVPPSSSGFLMEGLTPNPMRGQTTYEGGEASENATPQRVTAVLAVVCAILGLAAAIVAVIYYTVPAHSLPSFLGSLPKNLASLARERNVHRTRRGELAVFFAIVLVVVAAVLGIVSRRSSAAGAAWGRLLGARPIR